jgi:zinc-ribbon domain
MGEPSNEKASACHCPYCDVEIDVSEEAAVICIACKTVIIECVHCGEPVRDGVETCPHCGEPPS